MFEVEQHTLFSGWDESTNKGVNQSSKYITQVQQQRPQSPTVTLIWHSCKYNVPSLHQRDILIYSWDE